MLLPAFPLMPPQSAFEEFSIPYGWFRSGGSLPAGADRTCVEMHLQKDEAQSFH